MATIDNVFESDSRRSKWFWPVIILAVLALAGIGLNLYYKNKQQPVQKVAQAPKPVTQVPPVQPQVAPPVTQAPQSAPQVQAQAPAASAPKAEAKPKEQVKPAAKPAPTVPGQGYVLASSKKSPDTPRVVYYASHDQCEAAWRAGRAVGYQPTAKHRQFGDARISGYEKRPLEGDACVYLGAQPGKRWVFLKQGTLVYTQGPEVKFLAECQNDIYEASFLRKEEAAPMRTAKDENPGLLVTIHCETGIRNTVRVPEPGTRVVTIGDCTPKAPLVRGPDMDLRPQPPLVVQAPPPPVVQAPPPVVQAPPAIPPQAQAPCTNCREEAVVLGQEPAPHGVCGIRAVDQNRQTVGLIQIDNFQGRIRFARVAQWGGRPVTRPVVTDLPSSPRRNCDDDQAQVERHWAQVIKMTGLPLQCTPALGSRSPSQVQRPSLLQRPQFQPGPQFQQRHNLL